MSATAAVRSKTPSELLTLSEDRVEREWIRGQLLERPMTRSNRRHSPTMASLSRILSMWADPQPQSFGEVLAGDAALRLRRASRMPLELRWPTSRQNL